MSTSNHALRRTIDASIALALPGGAKVAPILRRVDGWLYPHEAVYLYWLARRSTEEAGSTAPCACVLRSSRPEEES